MVWLPSSFLFAGGKITGLVTTSLDGKPLSGAHVLVKETGQGAITDSLGRYTLRIQGAGKYRIRASYLGYNTIEKIIKYTDGQTATLNFSLQQTVYEAAEVEITGTRPDQTEQDVPHRMDLISAQTITDNPGQNITSVLDYVSGVNLSSTMGVFSNNTVVSLRGLSGNDQGRTLILVDNMPLNKSDEGSVNWNLINRENVEQIEVTKGPGGARYGSSAMGGVINIRTRKATEPIAGSATLGYGAFNTLGFRYALNGILGPHRPSRGFYYDLNGFYRQSDGYNAEIPEYLEPGDTFTVNTFLREASIGIKTGYRFNDEHSVEASAGFFNDKRGRGIEIYEVDGAYERHGTWQASIQYHGNHKNNSWNVMAYSLNEHFQRVNEYMSEAEYNLYLVKSLRSDLGFTADLDLVAGKFQQVTTGLEFKQGSVDGQDIYYTATDLITNKGKMENYAFFIQDAFRFVQNRLQFDIGIRLNYAVFHNGLFTIENPSYSIEYMVPYQDTLIPRHSWFQADPKFSVQYRFNPENRIYITIARGFRAPNLDDLCRTGKKSNGFKISNPALNPEILDNYETGADLALFKKLHLAPSFYYSIGHDFMYYVSTGDSVNMGYKKAPVFQKQNISRVDIYGMEFDLDIEPVTWLSVFANYAYAHSTITRYIPADPAVDVD
ncbi:MAG: TonB-dependent receptor, partial [Bacteroidales bacterium]|nr:TonB-dependent receptor [Bacteroidales bacterium]